MVKNWKLLRSGSAGSSGVARSKYGESKIRDMLDDFFSEIDF